MKETIMNTINKMLVAVIAITFVSTSSFAGSFGVGVAGHMVGISADGTETPGGTETGTENSVRTATAGNTVGFGSVFAEYNFGDDERFTLGVDYIPGSADVNSKNLSRVDGASGDSNDTAGTKTANAELSDHITYYGEFVITNGLFVKAGFSQVDVKTNDTTTSSGTDGAYGDKTLDAWTYGIGQKGTFGERGFYKVEGYITDYDNFNATQTGASLDDTSTNSTVSANLDVVGAALRLGYKF
jgi:hypothetical protein